MAEGCDKHGPSLGESWIKCSWGGGGEHREQMNKKGYRESKEICWVELKRYSETPC